MSLYDEFKNHFECLEEIQKEDLKNKVNIMQSAVNLLGLTEELLEKKQSSQLDETDLMLPADKSAFSYQERYEQAKQKLGEYLLTYSCIEADLEYMQKMKLYLELLEMFLLKESSEEVTEENLKNYYKKLNTFKEAYQKKNGKAPGKIHTWKQVREILNQAIERGDITTAYLLR